MCEWHQQRRRTGPGRAAQCGRLPRTEQVTGEVAIEASTVATATFVDDMASVRSDNAMHDAQYRDWLLDTDTYPTSAQNALVDMDDHGVIEVLLILAWA